MTNPHYAKLSDVPVGLATKAQLQALGLSKLGLKVVATVESFGKTINLYLISEAQSTANSSV
ncbi:hypothetical protein [Deinococcus roseus]|nr:hypothetical protein [Deinococcus roseus]